MEVFKVSAYYKVPHGLRMINLAAACPTGEWISVNITIKCCTVKSTVAFYQQVASSSLRISSLGMYLAV